MEKNDNQTPYWNGKTSDHPLIQEMIRLDNEVFQIHENQFHKLGEKQNGTP